MGEENIILDFRVLYERRPTTRRERVSRAWRSLWSHLRDWWHTDRSTVSVGVKVRPGDPRWEDAMPLVIVWSNAYDLEQLKGVE